MKYLGDNLHIYPSDIIHESRLFRETAHIASISPLFRPVIVGKRTRASQERFTRTPSGIPVHRIDSPSLFNRGFLFKAIATIFWQLRVLLFCFRRRCSVINCHSLPLLPLSVVIAFYKKCPLVYDTHELETETCAVNGARSLFTAALERLLIGRCDAVVTVCDSISRHYAELYPLNRPPVTVRNIPPECSNDAYPTPEILHSIRQSGGISYLYIGLLAQGRGLNILIDAFRGGPQGHHLVLVGFGPLYEHCSEAAREVENIHLLPAVKPHEVVPLAGHADVGLTIIENISLSYYYCLPNKLFEYLHAGTPQIASNFPEMQSVITSYGIGWTVDPSVEGIRECIGAMSHEAIETCRRATAVAQGRLSWTNECAVLSRVMIQAIDQYRRKRAINE